ncbi:MAG TPA: serine/threonine-protein kinase [Kofleriaceae bacterium]|nr:serine/threonine-protein kinase [Kofleriaceae bacterium]
MFVCAECGASQPAPGHCTADGQPLYPVGDDPILGATIGPYRVARLLGIGGMGRVYKGVHPTIGSRVAIKVLSRECSDRRDLVDRFFAEAKAVNLIRHESIVNVLDLAMLPDGRPYIVMEYLDGSPLSSIVDTAARGAPLPIGGVARLAAEVLDALGAAHAKGIIHRDLKPDNIFVTPAGRAKVLDFGIAKLQPELGGSSTHTGSLMGTPHYMSPEQAAGRSVDLRADIYAIGVILFECTTGQRPFSAPALFDLLRMHIEAPPPSPRALRPEIPPALEQVIYQALAKQPEQRFASTQAMSMALQQATSQLPPAQWQTLVGSTSRSSPSGGWQPTPPASWANSQHRNSHAVSPTQTGAGQVAAASKPRPTSKKGLWLGLGALLLVGGGVTAGVLIASSSGSKQTVAQNTPEPPPTPSPDPQPAPVPPTPAPPAPPDNEHTTTPPAPPAGDPWGEDDPVAEALIDSMLSKMPPEQIKMLPKSVQALLKKYGSWSKVPKKERDKVGVDVAAAVAQLQVGAMTDINNALAGMDEPPEDSTHGTGLGPDGWVISRTTGGPPGFDPKKVDASKSLTWALAEAKRMIPDAVLFRIDATGVYPDGHADLTMVENGSLDFRFISPSRMKRDPKKPIGAKVERRCMFRIELTKDGAWSAPIDGWECKETLVGPPKCTFAKVWKKALAKGAPSNAIGTLGYRADFNGVTRWYFDIDDPDMKFGEIFSDDC